MAVTVVGDTVNLAGGGTLNIQPASGQTYLLKSFALSNVDLNADTDRLALYDGTDLADIVLARRVISGSTNLSPNNSADMGIPLTNSQYARIVKGLTGDVGWRGVRLDV